MEIFNIIAGTCSILALILSFVAIKKVVSIEAKIAVDTSMKNTKVNVKGDGSKAAGRDING
jgi:hypothetical protein